MKIFTSVNPLYLMIGKVDEHIEENNGNKCLWFSGAGQNILSKKQRCDIK